MVLVLRTAVAVRTGSDGSCTDDGPGQRLVSSQLDLGTFHAVEERAQGS